MTPRSAYTREAFEQLRSTNRRRERKDGLVLAIVSVGMGLGQLGLMSWIEGRFPRGTAVAIEGAVFLSYAGLVLWLLWRLQHHKHVGAPRCPHCATALEGASERMAAATGRCDFCGGQVVA